MGSPEKPLSDLGAVSYKSYWAHEILKFLVSNVSPTASIMDISKATSIMTDDIVATLQTMGLLKYIQNMYLLWVPPSLLAELQARHPSKGPEVDPAALHWAPVLPDIKGKDKFSIKAKRPGMMDDVKVP